MSVTKDIRIKTGASTYDTRDIGAEAQYVDVSRDSNGNIIEDITEPGVVVASTEPLSETLGGMQEKLTFDSTPTLGSSNPVTSSGIYTAIQPDSALSPTSEKPVQNKVVTTALGNKVDLSLIGSTEPIGNVPSVPYKTGAYLVGSDKKLYRVTQDIAITDNIVVGTNVVEEPVVVGLDRIQSIETEIADMNNITGAKNLLPNEAVSTVVKGIIWTVNADGTVHAQGAVASGESYSALTIKLKPIFNGPVILNGCPNGGSSSTWQQQYTNNVDVVYRDTGEGVLIENQFDYSTYPTSAIMLVVYAGAGTVDVTFEPMLRSANIKDDSYAPYAMTNREATLQIGNVENLMPKNYGIEDIPFQNGGAMDANLVFKRVRVFNADSGALPSFAPSGNNDMIVINHWFSDGTVSFAMQVAFNIRADNIEFRRFFYGEGWKPWHTII